MLFWLKISQAIHTMSILYWYQSQVDIGICRLWACSYKHPLASVDLLTFGWCYSIWSTPVIRCRVADLQTSFMIHVWLWYILALKWLLLFLIHCPTDHLEDVWVFRESWASSLNYSSLFWLVYRSLADTRK